VITLGRTLPRESKIVHSGMTGELDNDDYKKVKIIKIFVPSSGLL
jgi:hypothetical protein